MTQISQIYKCEVCGNIVEVLHTGIGELVCCGSAMKLFPEKSADKATEKHVPVVEKTADGFKVTVGSAMHPMLENHYIEWIELVADGVAMKKALKPGDQPVAEFRSAAKQAFAREWCNLHGLWKGTL